MEKNDLFWWIRLAIVLVFAVVVFLIYIKKEPISYAEGDEEVYAKKQLTQELTLEGRLACLDALDWSCADGRDEAAGLANIPGRKVQEAELIVLSMGAVSDASVCVSENIVFHYRTGNEQAERRVYSLGEGAVTEVPHYYHDEEMIWNGGVQDGYLLVCYEPGEEEEPEAEDQQAEAVEEPTPAEETPTPTEKPTPTPTKAPTPTPTKAPEPEQVQEPEPILPGWYTLSNLNVREQTNVESAIVGAIPEGARVEYLVESDTPGWYTVKHQGLEGFVSAEYVEYRE